MCAIKNIILFITANFLLGVCSCFADGCFVLKTGEHATEPSQRATIFYDNGVQDTFLQVSLEGEVSEFGWLVPVPSKPTLEQIEKIPEFETNRFFRSTPIEGLAQLYWLYGDSHSNYNTIIPNEPLLDSVDYETHIISPTDSNIEKWLNMNQFIASNEMLKIIKNYQQKEWYICAVKVNASKLKKFHQGFLPPIKISFKTDKPVLSRQLSATAKTSTKLSVNLLTSKVYNPIVKLKPKDIPSEKSAIKYCLFEGRCPKGVILKPLTYSETKQAINTKIFRRSQTAVYPNLYNVNLSKWYTPDESNNDLYFETGFELMFENLTAQLNLYMNKGYRKDYDLSDYTPKVGFTLNQVKQLKPIKPYTNIQENIDDIINKKSQYYTPRITNESDFVFDDNSSLEDYYSRFIHIGRYNKTTNKIEQKVISTYDLVDMITDSFEKNRWNEELFDLQRNFSLISMSKTKKPYNWDTISEYNDYDTIQGNLYPNIECSSRVHGNIVYKLSKMLKIWSPNIDNKAIPSAKHLTETYNVNSSIPSTLIELRETHVLLRKLVACKLNENSDSFTRSGLGLAKEMIEEFFSKLQKRDLSLIPQLIEWLNSENVELKNNAVIALAYFAFLPQGEKSQIDQIISRYRVELNRNLPLNPYIKSDDNFWGYILRLNYGLSTATFADDYFKTVKLVYSNMKHNNKRRSSSEESNFYSFDNNSILTQLDAICSTVPTVGKEDTRDLRERLYKHFFLENGFMEIQKGAFELLWAERLMQASKAPNSLEYKEEKEILEKSIKANKLEYPFIDFKIEDFPNDLYYGTAFIKDRKIRDCIFYHNSLDFMFLMRENTHQELACWLEKQYRETNKLRYKAWQKLCVKTFVLTPKDYYDFQDYLGLLEKTKSISASEKRQITKLHAVPDCTRLIHFSPDMTQDAEKGTTAYHVNEYRKLLTSVYVNYQQLPTYFPTKEEKEEQE